MSFSKAHCCYNFKNRQELLQILLKWTLLIPDYETGDEFDDDAFRWRLDSQSVMLWRRAKASRRLPFPGEVIELELLGDVNFAKSRATRIKKKQNGGANK